MTARATLDVLAEIRAAAGAEAVAAITRAKGGRRVRFPVEVRPRNWLVQLIGTDAAARLCAHFRARNLVGVELKIPLGDSGKYAQARREALRLRRAGRSIAETAGLVGVSTRTVEKWTAAARAASNGEGRSP